MTTMVDVAQLVEPRIVIPAVVGSSPIVHPNITGIRLFGEIPDGSTGICLFGEIPGQWRSRQTTGRSLGH